MVARLERGFIPLGLLGYGLLALGILGMLGGIVYKIREGGYDKARAELLPQLEACKASVAAQNAALEALRAEGAKKQARAAQALAKASESAKVWEDNAARLRAVLTAPRKAGDAAPTSCEAAWREIRK